MMTIITKVNDDDRNHYTEKEPSIRYMPVKTAGRFRLMRRYVPEKTFGKSFRKQMGVTD